MRPFAPARRAATAARIAWRDLRKDPRQGVLVALLVALPAVVLTTVSVVNASQQPTDAQRITQQLGATQAWVQVVGPVGAQVSQSLQDPMLMEVGDPSGDGSEPVDGLGATETAQVRDVVDLLPEGTRTLTIAPAQAYVAFDGADAADTLTTVVGPAWDPAFAGMYDVVTGSAPSDGQVMVSSELAERWGLEVGDTLTIGRGGAERSVAGIIAAPLLVDDGIVFGSDAALGTALSDSGMGPGPITYLPDLELDWDTVEALNADGVAVFSRAVVENPPQAYLDAAYTYGFDENAVSGGAIVGAGLGLLEVVLLAGAAFAVSMRRRQERLALLAATGAGRGALVSVGIWNGALLGLAGGLIGVPAGLAVGALWLWVLDTWGDVYTQVWGLQVTWWQLGAILVFTTASGALAALVPAIASARRDVMSALRGSRRPAKVRRWPAVIGAVLGVAAVAAFAFAMYLRKAAWNTPMDESFAVDARAEQVTLVGVVLLLAGLIALTPTALRVVARVLGPLGVSARIAARDAARHGGRTVPVVAAIAVTVILAGNVALETMRDKDLWEGSRFGQAQVGDGMVHLENWQGETPVYGDADALLERASEVVDDVEGVAIDQVASGYSAAAESRVTIARYPDESLCPTWKPEIAMYEPGSMTKREIAEDPRCADEFGSEVRHLAVGGPEELAYILGRPTTEAENAMLASDGAVVVDPLIIGPDAKGGSEGTLRLESWDVGAGTELGQGEPTEVLDVPAIVGQPVTGVTEFRVVLSPQAAAAAGADVVPGILYLHREEGFTELEEDQIEAALMRDGEFHFWVERAIEAGEELTIWGSLIATLLVAGAAAGLALGLARADARRDDQTLSSLGASPRLARSVAAWQGGILVTFAVWSGLACAAVLDVIRAMERSTPGAFAWDVLVIGLVVPPLVVAGLAWVMTRAPKAVHYRLAA